MSCPKKKTSQTAGTVTLRGALGRFAKGSRGEAFVSAAFAAESIQHRTVRYVASTNSVRRFFANSRSAVNALGRFCDPIAHGNRNFFARNCGASCSAVEIL
jgi:hypothetical protein